MKTRIRYCFSRLIVLIVALHTLDVSVDLDHITNSIGWFNVERYDDIDSISEYLIESLFHDGNLVKESNNDDRPRARTVFSQISLLLFLADNIKDWDVKPTCRLINKFRPSVNNTRFLFEDHSSTDYIPPDPGHSQFIS